MPGVDQPDYSKDLNTGHLNTRNIHKTEILKVIFWMVRLFMVQTIQNPDKKADLL